MGGKKTYHNILLNSAVKMRWCLCLLLLPACQLLPFSCCSQQ